MTVYILAYLKPVHLPNTVMLVSCLFAYQGDSSLIYILFVTGIIHIHRLSWTVIIPGDIIPMY